MLDNSTESKQETDEKERTKPGNAENTLAGRTSENCVGDTNPLNMNKPDMRHVVQLMKHQDERQKNMLSGCDWSMVNAMVNSARAKGLVSDQAMGHFQAVVSQRGQERTSSVQGHAPISSSCSEHNRPISGSDSPTASRIDRQESLNQNQVKENPLSFALECRLEKIERAMMRRIDERFDELDLKFTRMFQYLRGIEEAIDSIK